MLDMFTRFSKKEVSVFVIFPLDTTIQDGGTRERGDESSLNHCRKGNKTHLWLLMQNPSVAADAKLI